MDCSTPKFYFFSLVIESRIRITFSVWINSIILVQLIMLSVSLVHTFIIDVTLSFSVVLRQVVLQSIQEHHEALFGPAYFSIFINFLPQICPNAYDTIKNDANSDITKIPNFSKSDLSLIFSQLQVQFVGIFKNKILLC